jgi:hypothetical protein
MFINSDIRYRAHLIPPSHLVTCQASSSSFQLHKLFCDNLLPSMHRTSAWPLENSQQTFCQHLPFAPFLLHVPLFQLLPLTPLTLFILLLALQALATAFRLTCVQCNGAGKIGTGQPQLRIPSEASDFLVSKTSRPPLGPTHTFIQWIPGLKRPGR